MNNLFITKNNIESTNFDKSENKDIIDKENNLKISNTTINDFQQKINKRKTIISPRSVLALKRCGYKQEELYKKTLNEFIDLYPDLRDISKDIQERGYFLFDQEREKKVSKVIKTRQEIIDEENHKKVKNLENDSFSISNICLNKSSSFKLSKNSFNRTLKHYFFSIDLDKKKNKNKNSNSCLNKKSLLCDSNREISFPVFDDNNIKVFYHKSWSENKILQILTNKVNDKIIKNKLINKELLKNKYEKQKKELFQIRQIEEDKKLKWARYTKGVLVKEKEKRKLKLFTDRQSKVQIRLEQEKQKSKEKEREYHIKDIERKNKLISFKKQRKREDDELHNINDEKLKLYEEKMKEKIANTMRHREEVELHRKISNKKTRELIQKREDNILSKSQDVLAYYLDKQHNTEKILKHNESQRIYKYILKNVENENMKLQRERNKENIERMRETILMKDQMRLIQIKERQNEIQENNKRIKEEKKYYLQYGEMRRNQKMKSFEQEMINKKLNILENSKIREKNYIAVCKERDEKYKKNIEIINLKKFHFDNKKRELNNIKNCQIENLKKEIEFKLQKAEDYKKEQNMKKIEEKKELDKIINYNTTKYKEREIELSKIKEIDLQTLENMKYLLPDNQKLENLINKYKTYSLEGGNTN